MSENYNEYTVNGKKYRIYSNDYLLSHEFTSDDIDAFIEDDEEGYNLYASISVNACKFIGRTESEEELLNIMSSDGQWFRKITWTADQRIEYEKIVHDILMRCLDMESDEAWHEVEIWLAFGSAPGLSDKTEDTYSILAERENDIRGWKE